jgi:hypothetical protein
MQLKTVDWYLPTPTSDFRLLIWSGKLLLVLASTVILGSEPHGTQNHILLSHISVCHATIHLVLLVII